jgi:hypothetical protein
VYLASEEKFKPSIRAACIGLERENSEKYEMAASL